MMWIAETQETEENIYCASWGIGGNYLNIREPWSGIYFS